MTQGEGGDPLPKHHRVYLVLRQDILEGRYPSREALPNELVLADQFGVSRITIRKAMERLDREGLVVRQRGKGTFPLPGRESSPVQASISGELENLIAMGLKTEVRVISLEYLPATVEVAEALGLSPGDPVQKAIRVRSHAGAPFSILVTHLPADIGRTFTRDELGTQPLLLLLERAGAHVSRAEQTITARLANPEQAALLEMSPGDALLCIRRVVFDESDRPVEAIEGVYRPDTYQHQMSLGRKTHNNQRVWTPRTPPHEETS
jgi:GntR family transcriptional regulator